MALRRKSLQKARKLEFRRWKGICVTLLSVEELCNAASADKDKGEE